MGLLVSRNILLSAVAIAAAVAPLAVRADELMSDGLRYSNVTVLGLKGDKLAVNTPGGEKAFELAKISWITIDKTPQFNQAEAARDDDAKKSAAFYRTALQQEMTGKALRPLGQIRAVAPTAADGRYTEAMTLFLTVYQQVPTAAIWNLRPAPIPAAPSSMLGESADLIEKKLPSFTSDEAKHNLQLLQVDLYTKAGDTKNAARIAGLLNGTPDDKTTGSAAPVESAITTADLAPIEDALKNGKNDTAIELIDKLLPRADNEGAARLYVARARALAAGQKPELAIAAYLRVPIFYPTSNLAPTALLAAAQMQDQLKHPDEAQRLRKEITDKYADSPEALKAK